MSRGSKQGRDEGEKVLKASLPAGEKPLLSTEQKAPFPALLALLSPAYGYRGDVWTTSPAAPVIAPCLRVRETAMLTHTPPVRRINYQVVLPQAIFPEV